MPAQENLRMTHQRTIILEELRSVTSHPTADELYALVKKRLPRISLATVYRNLETLAQSGMVRKLAITGRQKRFDGDLSLHDHITCTVCNRIDDIFPGEDDVQVPLPPGKLGYTLSEMRVHYYGICPECQSKMQSAADC